MWRNGIFLLISVISIQLFVGCNRSQQGETSCLFTKVDSIQWSILETDAILPIANDMVATDSLVYLLGLLDNKWIHSYSCDTGHHIGDYINQGNGPEDLINAFDMTVKTDSILSIFDINEQRMKLFDIESLKLTKSVKLSKHLYTIWSAYSLENGNFLVKCPSKKEDDTMVRSFSIINGNNFEVESTYDNLTKEFEDEPLSLLVQADLSISPDCKYFVSVTTLGGSYEIFNIENNKIDLINSELIYPVQFREDEGIKQLSTDQIIGFTSVTSTNKFWIAAYSGTNREEDAKKIGIWNWNGDPIKGFITDKIILKLAMLPDLNILYGLLVNEEGDIVIGKINLNLAL